MRERQVGQPVRGEQEVQPPRHPQLLPGLGRLLRTGGAQADLGEGVRRVAVDGVEHLLDPEALHQVGGAPGPDVLDPLQVAR